MLPCFLSSVRWCCDLILCRKRDNFGKENARAKLSRGYSRFLLVGGGGVDTAVGARKRTR